MQFAIEYPIGAHGYDREFLEPDQLLHYVRSAEDLGFAAVAFTEHLPPSKKWLEAGGHHSFDPLTALAFVAAGTQRIKLMTYLLVLPYRNPLLLSKQVSTVDLLSGGRTILCAGSGYLRSEFLALGVDFDTRNERFDETIEVLRKVWTTEEFEFEGSNFRAVGQVSHPLPAQLPHPPIWIGGNSAKARERVAASGQGWTPMLGESVSSKTTRTASLPTVASLRTAIADLHRRAEAHGRDPETIDIQVRYPLSDVSADSAVAVDAIGELAEAGVTWIMLHPSGAGVEVSLDGLREYSVNVMGAFRGGDIVSPASSGTR